MILHCNNLNFKLYFLFLFLFTLFSLFILAVKQYREQKSCRIEKISKDRKFVERNCLNPEDIIGQGLEEECKVGITAKPIIFLYLIIIIIIMFLCLAFFRIYQNMIISIEAQKLPLMKNIL